MENEKVANSFVAFFITYGKIKGLLTAQTKKDFQALIAKVR